MLDINNPDFEDYFQYTLKYTFEELQKQRDIINNQKESKKTFLEIIKNIFVKRKQPKEKSNTNLDESIESSPSSHSSSSVLISPPSSPLSESSPPSSSVSSPPSSSVSSPPSSSVSSPPPPPHSISSPFFSSLFSSSSSSSSSSLQTQQNGTPKEILNIHQKLLNCTENFKPTKEIDKKLINLFEADQFLLNENGESPITTLVKSNGNIELIYYSLIALAWFGTFFDINVPDFNLMNAVDYSIELGDERILKLMLLNGGKPTSPYIRKSEKYLKNLEKFKNLIYSVEQIRSFLKRANSLYLSIECPQDPMPFSIETMIKNYTYNHQKPKQQPPPSPPSPSQPLPLPQPPQQEEEEEKKQDGEVPNKTTFDSYIDELRSYKKPNLEIEKLQSFDLRIRNSYEKVNVINPGYLYISDDNISSGGKSPCHIGFFDGKLVACKSVSIEKIDYKIAFVKEVGVYHLNNNVPIKLVGISFENERVATIVMELAECTLTQYLKNPNNRNLLTWETVFSFIDSMLHQIKYIHDNCTVHRDIKTCNFLVTKNGQLALSDFGDCRIKRNEESLDQGKEEDVSLFKTKGTAGYMPPEVGDIVYSKASDICICGYEEIDKAITNIQTKIEVIESEITKIQNTIAIIKSDMKIAISKKKLDDYNQLIKNFTKEEESLLEYELDKTNVMDQLDQLIKCKNYHKKLTEDQIQNQNLNLYLQL
ncbi:hypothetical protein ACTFIU_001938 [Dictyostelium citrinum]